MNRGIFTLIALAALLAGGCRAEQVAAPATEAAAADPASLVPHGAMPVPGVLTGGQPSDEQLAALRDAGYQTVINLRHPNEKGTGGEAEKVAALGMSYLSLPITGAGDLTEENAAALAAALDEAARPVLLHCASSNRVGALLALKAFWLDGASAQEALDIGRSGGMTRLEQAVREIVDTAE